VVNALAGWCGATPRLTKRGLCATCTAFSTAVAAETPEVGCAGEAKTTGAKCRCGRGEGIGERWLNTGERDEDIGERWLNTGEGCRTTAQRTLPPPRLSGDSHGRDAVIGERWVSTGEGCRTTAHRTLPPLRLSGGSQGPSPVTCRCAKSGDRCDRGLPWSWGGLRPRGKGPAPAGEAPRAWPSKVRSRRRAMARPRSQYISASP